MKENTVVLPKIINLSSGTSGDIDSILQNSQNQQFQSSLNSVDRYLVNKKCSTNYFPDLSSPTNNDTSCSSKRVYNSAFESKYHNSQSDGFPISKRRNNSNINYEVSNNQDRDSLLKLINNGDQSVIDKITYLSTSNVKKIMELLNKATSIKDFQTQLQSLILNMCIDLYKDQSNDDTVTTLKKKVNYLNDEKVLLSNVIKSQYESIRKLKEDEYNVTKSEEEKQALKAEVGRLKQVVNNLIYKEDKQEEAYSLNDYINRKPPDVY